SAPSATVAAGRATRLPSTVTPPARISRAARLRDATSPRSTSTVSSLPAVRARSAGTSERPESVFESGEELVRPIGPLLRRALVEGGEGVLPPARRAAFAGPRPRIVVHANLLGAPPGSRAVRSSRR